MNNTNTSEFENTMQNFGNEIRRSASAVWGIPLWALYGETSESQKTESAEPEKELGYQATYIRRSTGNTAIDLNSISREYVSANTLEELNATLSTLAINQPGFSVLKVEKL